MSAMIVCFQLLGKVKRRKLHKFVTMGSIPYTIVYSTLKGKPIVDFSAESQLILELGQHDIILAVADLHNNVLIDIEMIDLHEDISPSLVFSYLDQIGVGSANFKKVNFIFNTKEYALIPSSVHNPLFHRQLIEIMHGDLLDLEYDSNHLSLFEAVNVYGVSREINTVLDSFFSNATRKHKNACIVKVIAAEIDSLSECFIKIFFAPAHFDIIIVNSGKLQFLNKYYYETPEDALYFIFSLTEKFNLNKKSVELYASGIIDLNSMIFFEIKKHFPVLKIEVNNQIATPANMSGIPLHYLTPIMTSLQCV